MKRREFSKTTAAAGVLTVTGMNALQSMGANDRIRVGIIGCGVRGGSHISMIMGCRKQGLNVEISHICDVWSVHRNQAVEAIQKQQGKAPIAVVDYKEILSCDDVDAITIATPDHTHSRIMKEAAEAGKDIYVEKPMAIDLKGACESVDAAKKNGRVVQAGTQWRSDPNYIGCAETIQSGVLGKITRAAISQNFIQPRWRKDYSSVKKEDVDWPRFIMDAPKRPFDAKRLRRWYLYRDYSNGLPGLWMSHYLNFVSWCMEDPFPAYGVASGQVYLWGDDGRQTSDTLSAILDYPKGWQLNFSMSLCNSADTHCVFYGTNGKLEALKRKLSGDGGAGPDQIKGESDVKPVPSTGHMHNFLECVRTREQPRSNVDAGFSHAVSGIMVAEAIRTGRRVVFDPAKREFDFS